MSDFQISANDMTIRRRLGSASKAGSHQTSHQESHDENWELVSRPDRIDSKPDMDREPDDVQEQKPGAELPGSDWKMIHTVLLPAQQQSIYAWKRLEICSLGVVRRVDLGYGYSPTQPEYYMSCHLQPQKDHVTKACIKRSIENVMIRYLEHRRKWACSCSLLEIVLDGDGPETVRFHGPTPALEGAGLKHFLLDSSRAPKLRECPKDVKFWTKLFGDFFLDTWLTGHDCRCTCGCLGRIVLSDGEKVVNETPKEGWVIKEFSDRIKWYV